jgi:hypothetical protein
MWGALSDERTGLSFAKVTASSNVCCQLCTVYIVVAPNVFKITPQHGPRTENTYNMFIIPPVHWGAGRT